MSISNPVSILYDVNGNPIGVNTNPLAVQLSGSISLAGSIQSGSTTTGFPTLIGGADSNGILRGLLTDTAGKLFVSGSVAIANTVTMSGSVNVTNTLTAVVSGQVQSGSTAQGNPVLTAGSDSSGIVRALRTDTSGQLSIVGTTLSGSTATNTAPVQVAGIDVLGIVRTLKTSPSGILQSTPSSSSSSVSSVAASASSVTLLSSNTQRLGVIIFNDSSQILYVKLGATASSTSYTVQLVARGYYEVPFGYVGQIDGIWAAATGNARITELS